MSGSLGNENKYYGAYLDGYKLSLLLSTDFLKMRELLP
jgi:hypothetical protein